MRTFDSASIKRGTVVYSNSVRAKSTNLSGVKTGRAHKCALSSALFRRVKIPPMLGSRGADTARFAPASASFSIEMNCSLNRPRLNLGYPFLYVAEQHMARCKYSRCAGCGNSRKSRRLKSIVAGARYSCAEECAGKKRLRPAVKRTRRGGRHDQSCFVAAARMCTDRHHRARFPAGPRRQIAIINCGNGCRELAATGPVALSDALPDAAARRPARLRPTVERLYRADGLSLR